jgi:hypothetical protein
MKWDLEQAEAWLAKVRPLRERPMKRGNKAD